MHLTDGVFIKRTERGASRYHLRGVCRAATTSEDPDTNVRALEGVHVGPVRWKLPKKRSQVRDCQLKGETKEYARAESS